MTYSPRHKKNQTPRAIRTQLPVWYGYHLVRLLVKVGHVTAGSLPFQFG
jgi:hypothetical protein